jgi:serine/threonine protein kinase
MAENTFEAIPTQIGRYRVEDKIGSGGMGAVYRCRHPDTNLPVAVKVITYAEMDDVLLRRFEQEIAATCRLNHPNIVRGLDYGRYGEYPFLVMEYVAGESLGDRIVRDCLLPEADAVAIIVQASAAIDYIHRRGIIHRDIKPDNILIGTDGTVKITDMGLIKNTGMDLNLTGLATGLGTPNFMAPEQFSDARAADPRCDIYSLGASLYMALAGELPFDARTDLAILKKKLTDDLTGKKPQIAPNLNRRVEEAIRRSVKSDPEQRYATASDFVEALTGEPLPEPDVPPPEGAVDRRLAVRYKSSLNGRCGAVGGGEGEGWPARIKDVSVHGIGLLLRRRFEPRTILSLEVEREAGKPTLSYTVRVVRNHDTGNGLWLLGCIFLRPVDEDIMKTLL